MLPRSSPLSRYALAAYLLIVVDASLYPFVGWRDLGWGPYDYLLAGWPRRVLPFDAAANALGYVPLGFLAGLALHPRVRGFAAIVSGTLLCAFVSIHLEALQTYLPSRVASNVDLLTNVAGGLLGAVLSARAARPLLDAGRLRVWRTRWFASDTSRGLLLVLAWFAALIYPDAFVLGTGGVSKAFTTVASGSLATWLGLEDQVDPSAVLRRFQNAETAVAALTMLGAGLLFLNLMRPGLRWPMRVALLAALVAGTVATATLAHAFLFDEAVDWPPLTPGARRGLIGAVLCLLGATVLPSRVRWIVGLAALSGALVLVNVYPDNPYGMPVDTQWSRGKLLNFYGLTSGLNLVWPYLAILYLLRHRGTAARRPPVPTGRRPPV